MSAILPLFFLAVTVILLAVMLWRRPDPNHLFALDLLNRLQDGTPDEPNDGPCPREGSQSQRRDNHTHES